MMLFHVKLKRSKYWRRSVFQSEPIRAGFIRRQVDLDWIEESATIDDVSDGHPVHQQLACTIRQVDPILTRRTEKREFDSDRKTAAF